LDVTLKHVIIIQSICCVRLTKIKQQYTKQVNKAE